MKKISILILLVVFYSQLFAVESVGVIQSVSGVVTVDYKDKTNKARQGSLLFVGTLISTRKGMVSIILRDGSEVRLYEDTVFAIKSADELKTKSGRHIRFKFYLLRGNMWADLTDGVGHVIQTQTSIIETK